MRFGWSGSRSATTRSTPWPPPPGRLASQSLPRGPTRTTGSALRATHDAEPESRWLPLVQHPPATRPHPARLNLDTMDCDAPRCRRPWWDPADVLVDTTDTDRRRLGCPRATPRPVVDDLGLAACLARSLAGCGGPQRRGRRRRPARAAAGWLSGLTRTRGGDDPSRLPPRPWASPCTARTRLAGREPGRWDG